MEYDGFSPLFEIDTCSVLAWPTKMYDGCFMAYKLIVENNRWRIQTITNLPDLKPQYSTADYHILTRTVKDPSSQMQTVPWKHKCPGKIVRIRFNTVMFGADP